MNDLTVHVPDALQAALHDVIPTQSIYPFLVGAIGKKKTDALVRHHLKRLASESVDDPSVSLQAVNEE